MGEGEGGGEGEKERERRRELSRTALQALPSLPLCRRPSTPAATLCPTSPLPSPPAPGAAPCRFCAATAPGRISPAPPPPRPPATGASLLRVAGGPTAPHRPPQRHPLACAGGGADAGRLWVGAAMGPRRESEDSRTRVSQVSMAQIKLLTFSVQKYIMPLYSQSE